MLYFGPCSAFGLICSFGRFTPSHVWPLFWAWFCALPLWTLQPQLIVRCVQCSISTRLGSDLPRFQAMDTFFSCGYTYAFSFPRRERLSSCLYFLSSFSVCLRSPLRYWSLFARTSQSTITQQRWFSWIKLSLMLLALRFGTEIRLCWCWQSLYGAPILGSTSKVSPFPPRRRPGISYDMGCAQMF